ncbi:response regulator transcription factor [Clostridium estertheticum]|uniref:Stage 0 sporulation protein A homolog n=2 Tax=Clostridium estertheticum TaxID=238834 RepID=A0A1J0GGV2_9CLOT|nr:response regulator transcription factor [Clostridium estertheticum]APC40503.1 DNA-binding response regulator [Clostridium estertheticum subsp. estertheticum]MBU3074526.1 response regulator transcription factor [Clostridium estertheticum]MBU3165990.1 response regulator transcription factor [Clostridium estertheticum]MBU3173870.1 response regulator transcription factor [Clostridium estertheticum]MBU3187321.1 response regulator transcription factor [Clostridium estertheticum]
MNEQKILIIEDEVKIARFLELELKYEGYIVSQSHDGREGLDKAMNEAFDLILLDIMLPSLNGLEVLRRLRQVSDIPIIMLTAKDEIMDKVTGLDIGANDYMTKPFAIEELLARIRTALKKNMQVNKSSNILSVGELIIDLDQHMVSFNNNSIDLTKTEFDLLKLLVDNKNIVLTRNKIIDIVWGYEYMGDTNVVDVYIRYLRSKIDDRFSKKFIYTVRGVGYLLKDE